MAALATVAALACNELKKGESVGAGVEPGADGAAADEDGSIGPVDDASGPGAFEAGPKGDAGVGPSAACRPIPLDCLDPAPANVIEVPSESTLQDAFANAKASDVVQVRGRALGAGWQVPAYVTLRGCEGASITGNIGFAGSGGNIEGFVVSGTIVANRTGSYVVRYNRFTGGGSPNEAGVSGRSIDALVAATVELTVDSNAFDNRERGVEARTNYDTLTHAVTITVRNNAFVHVARPFVAAESGLVGVINARIEHNTFYDFDTAISLQGVDRKSTTSGNLFVRGAKGIEGSAYDVAYSFAWQVTTPAATPPVSGTFASGDPALVDADAGDLRLGATSAVIDAIPNGAVVPGEDYLGCPRPAGGVGAAPKSDVGAFESQP
ncbi:MAG: hypothetical protein KF764_15960 [Labilithrix sp.]|nr:hypothetical protein [Labilithrix sp.]